MATLRSVLEVKGHGEDFRNIQQRENIMTKSQIQTCKYISFTNLYAMSSSNHWARASKILRVLKYTLLTFYNLKK